jgi:hypothetical protein
LPLELADVLRVWLVSAVEIAQHVF